MGKEPPPGDARPRLHSHEAGSNAESAAAEDAGRKYVEKHAHIRGRGLISSSALGVSDGLVTNLAFLTGFAGAVSGIDLIRFAGLAAMLAGAVSMFFGGLLSARSEADLFRADAKREAYEIDHEREEEVWELKHLYKAKGLTDEEAEVVVTRVSSDKRKFLEDMLVNELHLHESNLQNPLRVGSVIGVSFLIGSLVPLAPYYVLGSKVDSVVVSVFLSLAFLFVVGAWKGRIVKRRAWVSGLETLLLGAVAAALLFAIGSAFTFV